MIPDSIFLPPQSLVFVSSKSLFRSSQSLGFVLFRVIVSPSSKSRFLPSLSVPFLPLRPLSSSSKSSPLLLRVPCPSSPSSQSPLPSSDSRSRPLHPLPSSFALSHSSSSKPKKTAERHEAVPPFLVGVVSSKMEHDSFTSCSSTVCSRKV